MPHSWKSCQTSAGIFETYIWVTLTHRRRQFCIHWACVDVLHFAFCICCRRWNVVDTHASESCLKTSKKKALKTVKMCQVFKLLLLLASSVSFSLIVVSFLAPQNIYLKIHRRSERRWVSGEGECSTSARPCSSWSRVHHTLEADIHPRPQQPEIQKSPISFDDFFRPAASKISSTSWRHARAIWQNTCEKILYKGSRINSTKLRCDELVGAFLENFLLEEQCLDLNNCETEECDGK